MHCASLLRILLLLLLVSPAQARAFVETCTLPAGNYDWTAPCSVSQGEITGCACHPGDPDRWLLPTNAAVRCPEGASADDVEIALEHPQAELRIEPGGSLRIEAGCALGVPGGDLTVAGELLVQGKVLGFGGPSPAFTLGALADSPDPAQNSAIRVADVIHCPGSFDGDALLEDCAGAAPARPGSRAQIALCWPLAIPSIAEWLAQIAPGDVLAFWDPSDGLAPPRDVNAFYRIDESSVPGGEQRCLIANVHQGAGGTGYGLAKREIRAFTLSASYPAEARTVQVGSDEISADKQGVARWLTCRTPGGVPHTQKITEVDDDPAGDTLRLLPGGFPVSFSEGTRCYLDYGWMPGDVVSVFRPALLADGTPGEIADSTVWCNAGAHCDFDFAQLAMRSPLYLFESSDIDDSWISDAAGGIVLFLVNWTTDNVSQRVQMTSHRRDDAHSVSIDGEGFEGGTLIDWNLRHSEDDYFVINNCSVRGSTCIPGSDQITDQKLVLRRLRVGYMGCTGGSCSIIDTNSSAGSGLRDFSLDLDGLLAEAPSGDGANFYLGRGGFWNVRNLALVAAGYSLFEDFAGTSASARNTIVRNVYDIGRDAGTFSFEILGAIRSFSDVSLIEPRLPTAVANLRTFWPLGGAWNRILVLDPRNNYSWLLGAIDTGGPVVIRDLALVGFDRAAGSGGFALWLGARAGGRGVVRIEGLTLALRPGARAGQQGAILVGGDDAVFDSYRVLSGVLVANFAGEPAGAPALLLAPEDLDGVSNVCLEGNEEDGVPAAGLAGTVLRNAGLEYVDPARGNFSLRPGSPGYGICGARDPGAEDMWALRVLHHDPYRFGDSWKTGPWNGGDGDADLDAVPDAGDNCPFAHNPGQQDRDSDLLGDACDLCPDFANAANHDRDGNGIGDACECGDQSGDGIVDVRDLLAINLAILDPAQASPLCDTNHDLICNVRDILGARAKILGGAAHCSRYPPPAP